MEFRPCIDIHNGKVKQIVGGSLLDQDDFARENFVSEKSAADYARLYGRLGLSGGHVILLNHAGSDYYEATKRQALEALRAFPGGLQVGGGINCDNAMEFLEAGARAVIVTSYVFREGKISFDNLRSLRDLVGRERLVLDLSCRSREGRHYVVTDRWQTFTDMELNRDNLELLESYCGEFLVHGVDVEGKRQGIEEELVRLLADCSIPVTYAGGVGSYGDLELLRTVGRGKVNVTIGSALDLFGGDLEFERVIREFCQGRKTP